MNFSMIRYVIGLVMLFESAFLSLPCLIALIYHEKKGFSFWIMLFVCLIIGILFVMKKPKKTVYYAKEGFLTVAISWIVMSFFGALPFVINGDIPSVVDAMFETVSGFTTMLGSIAFILSPVLVFTTHPFSVQGPSGEPDSARPM